MRRSTAISQVVLLLAFYLVPLVAGSSAMLPACCRRDGAHHCGMQQSASSGQGVFSSGTECPYHLPAIALTHAPKLFISTVGFTTTLPGTHEVLFDENAGRASTQLSDESDNRGPPALTP